MSTAMKDAATPRSDGQQRRLDRAPLGNNFPSKLHYILGELEKDGLSHVAKWASHGRCFVILDRDAFVDQVLRLWFSMTKYTSFQRQLNIYGFQRIETGIDEGALHLEMFVRDMPSLVNCIPRLHNKSILKGCMGHRPSETHRRSNLDVYRMAAPSMATTKTTASSTRVGEINSSERDNVTSSNDASPTSITRPEQVLQDLVAVALRQEQQRLQQQQQEQQTLLDATIGLLQAHRQAMALVTWPATLHRTSSKGPHDILGTNNRFILGTGTGPTEPVQDLSRQSLILALLNGTSRP